MSTTYDQVPTTEIINQTVKALQAHGFDVQQVSDGPAAKELALRKIPKGAKVFSATSETARLIGLSAAVDESGDFDALRPKIAELRAQVGKQTEARKLGSVPEVVVGSAAALTQDGKIMIASASGSQIPAEVYGADTVILVVGAQKIVKNLAAGIQRIEEHILPLEDERAMNAYGMHTAFNKLLVINGERPGRIHIIVINENIGF